MQNYKAASENYRRLASDRGVNPSNVVLDMGIGADEGGGPPQVKNEADYNALPAGTVYIDPDGKQRTKG
jgi:hypothetical protein